MEGDETMSEHSEKISSLADRYLATLRRAAAKPESPQYIAAPRKFVPLYMVQQLGRERNTELGDLDGFLRDIGATQIILST